MKQVFLFLLLCLASCMYGQSGTECAANAGVDQSVCVGSGVKLNAPVSLDYNNPPNIQWTCVSVQNGTIQPGDVSFTSPNDYVTGAMYNGGPLPVGTYTFQFCVDCKDLNNDGQHDRPCDNVVVTVTPEPTEPQIIESDGSQDGFMTVCQSATVGVNLPGAGEIASVDYFPSDGRLSYDLSGNTLTLKYIDNTNTRQEQCTYTITYYISNGGCTSKKSIEITFISPYDPNEDGIIEGFIYLCPSCSKTICLYGDRPGGCYGEGKWELVSGPGTVTFTYENLEYGDACVEVSAPGNYTFRYSVTNIGPCPDSEFEVSCTVLDIDEFSLGPDIDVLLCENVIPAGST
ncbi:MAG: hypothetical protein KDC70_02480, partial [Saprospiraceae bacterium]|nr:hypothetical protein [Saprospiraceae bacterium]